MQWEKSTMREKEDLLKRAYRHWYADGLGEIMQGVVFLLVALYFWAQVLVRDNRTLTVIVSLLIPFLTIGLIVSLRPVVNRLKERITYPRTGFVTYRRDVQKQRLRLGIRLGLGLVLGLSVGILGVGLKSGAVTWFYWILGTAYAAVFGYTGWRVGLPRFYAVGTIGLVSGLVLGVLNIPDKEGMIILFVTIGLPSLFIGLVVLRRFLQVNPPIDSEGVDYEPDNIARVHDTNEETAK
jgi:hypothetical protein